MKQVEGGGRRGGGGVRIRGFEVNGLLVELRGRATPQSDLRGAPASSPQWQTTTAIFASATSATKVLF